MVSYSPNGSTTHLPSLQRSAARCPRGWSRQSSCSWNVFFPRFPRMMIRPFRFFRVATSLLPWNCQGIRWDTDPIETKSSASFWPRCFSPSTATFFSSGLKAIVVIRSCGHRSEKHQQNSIKNQKWHAVQHDNQRKITFNKTMT